MTREAGLACGGQKQARRVRKRTPSARGGSRGRCRVGFQLRGLGNRWSFFGGVGVFRKVGMLVWLLGGLLLLCCRVGSFYYRVGRSDTAAAGAHVD